MKNKVITYAAFIAAVIAIGIAIWVSQSTPKIAYVNSAMVIEKYAGIHEAQKIIEQQENKRKTEMDTLYSRYVQSLNNYKKAREIESNKVLSVMEKNLQLQQQNYEKFKLETEKLSQEEQAKILQGALNQINSYVERYAEKNGIDIVIGITMSGNVLYGNERIDITEEIIKGINSEY